MEGAGIFKREKGRLTSGLLTVSSSVFTAKNEFESEADFDPLYSASGSCVYLLCDSFVASFATLSKMPELGHCTVW